MMNGPPYFACYPADFLEGTARLTPEEGWTYTLILMMIYAEGGPINYEDHERELVFRTGLSRRRLFEAIDTLILRKKLTRYGKRLANGRAKIELEKIEKKLGNLRKNSKKGGEKNRKKWQEIRKLTNENNGGPGPNGYPPGKPRGKPGGKQTRAKSKIQDSSSIGEARVRAREAKNQYSQVEELCREATGLSNSPAPALFDVSPIVGLINAGYDLNTEILPALRSHRNPTTARTWSYFVPQIQRFREKLRAGVPPPVNGSVVRLYERPPKRPKENPWIRAAKDLEERTNGPQSDRQHDGPTLDAEAHEAADREELGAHEAPGNSGMG